MTPILAEMKAPPQVPDHYQILDKLGSGEGSDVYRAVDRVLDREVTFRIFTAPFDKEHVHRFLRDMRATGALNHPNIGMVFDVGSEGGMPYIISPLLEGQTLRQRLSAGPVPIRQAIDYAKQIAKGLEYAHEHGIIHRDLKPENVFITNDGAVIILDFGVSSLRFPDRSELSVGISLGSPAYMSPEQDREHLRVDARSDIFSLGVILYEMIAGDKAFANRRTEIDDPWNEPFNLERLNAPGTLRKIIGRATAIRPEDRFESAKRFAFELGHLEATLSDYQPMTTYPPQTLTFPAHQVVRILGYSLAACAGTVAALAMLHRATMSSSLIPKFCFYTSGFVLLGEVCLLLAISFRAPAR